MSDHEHAPAPRLPARTGVMLGSWPLGMPADGGFYLDLARKVEELGYDLLFSGDHLFMYNDNAESLAVLAAWAGATDRVVLGTAVLLLALRDPAIAAKQLATVDYVSRGRLIVGVGVGGEIVQEWRAMEVPLASRGRRTDEYLDILAALWSGEAVDHQGTFRTVRGVKGSPRPARPGGPPIWVGGRSDAALERAARHQGWCAYAVSPERVRSSLERIRRLRPDEPDGFRVSYVLFAYVDDDRERAVATASEVLGQRYRQDFGRFIDAFCAVGGPDDVRRRVAEYRAAGVDDILLCPQAPWEEYGEQVERLADVLDVSPVRSG